MLENVACLDLLNAWPSSGVSCNELSNPNEIMLVGVIVEQPLLEVLYW